MKAFLGLALFAVVLFIALLIAGHADYLAACQSAACYR